MRSIRTVKDARNKYRDILQGYTYLDEEDLYIKHFAEADLGYIESLYRRCEKKLIKLGIECTKDKLSFLDKEGYWTRDEEIEYINVKNQLSDAHAFAQTLLDSNQKQHFEQTEMVRAEETLKKISDKRAEILNPTVESFCDRSINEHYVRLALYKDKEFKTPYLEEEEFKDMSYIELGNLVQKYNEGIEVFTDINFRNIAVNGFFLNAFLMCDNDPVKFYGKAVLEMTTYQMNLFGKGKYFKSILEEGESPPDSLYDSVEENGLEPIVNWYDAAFARIKSERDREKMKHKNAARRR